MWSTAIYSNVLFLSLQLLFFLNFPKVVFFFPGQNPPRRESNKRTRRQGGGTGPKKKMKVLLLNGSVIIDQQLQQTTTADATKSGRVCVPRDKTYRPRRRPKGSGWLENDRPFNTIIIFTSLFGLLWGFGSYLRPSSIFQWPKMAAKIGVISMDSIAIDWPRWALHVGFWMRDDPVNSLSANLNNYGIFCWKFLSDLWKDLNLNEVKVRFSGTAIWTFE